MKYFSVINDGRYVAKTLKPENGDIISKNELQQLLPFVKHAMKINGLNSYVSIRTTAKSGATLVISNVQQWMLLKISQTLNKHLSKKIILRQKMGENESGQIHFKHHYPLFFNISREPNIIEVRFTELHKSLNFEEGLKDLKEYYPIVAAIAPSTPNKPVINQFNDSNKKQKIIVASEFESPIDPVGQTGSSKSSPEECINSPRMVIN